MAEISVKETAEMLEKANKILVVSHERPDEDTLGCAFALKEAYKDKMVVTICEDKLNHRSISVFGDRDVSPSNADGIDFDLIVFVDTASFALSGKAGEPLKGKVNLRIDHHPSEDEYSEYTLLDTSASACGEIIFEVLKEAGRLTKEAAYCIYAAISSDSGCFRYSSTTSKTHRIAAELIDTGIDSWMINHMLYENSSRKEVNAKTIAYNNLKFFLDGKVAFLLFSNETKKKYSLEDGDLGEVSGLPRDIEGVELSIVVKQKDGSDDEYKISMRSGREISAGDICALFGGGGHHSAAGARVKASTPEEAEKIIMEKVLEYLGEKHAG